MPSQELSKFVKRHTLELIIYTRKYVQVQVHKISQNYVVYIVTWRIENCLVIFKILMGLDIEDSIWGVPGLALF